MKDETVARKFPELPCKSISSRVPQSIPKGIWGASDKKTFSTASPKAVFCPVWPDTVPTPRARPAPQGTVRARRTQQKARRGVAGPMRQRHIQV
jgi:hypothetical protein